MLIYKVDKTTGEKTSDAFDLYPVYTVPPPDPPFDEVFFHAIECLGIVSDGTYLYAANPTEYSEAPEVERPCIIRSIISTETADLGVDSVPSDFSTGVSFMAVIDYGDEPPPAAPATSSGGVIW